MNISLPEALKNYVEQQVNEGYSTPSEYVRELIREDQKRRSKEKLEALLLEGLHSGDSAAVNPQFWVELKRDALAKLKTSKKSKR